MSKGEVIQARREELQCGLPGARLWRFHPWEGSQYIPYFYNPPLDPDAGRITFVGNRLGNEQVYLLDLEQDTATQLTEASGTGQNWSPYIRENVDGIRPQFIAWSQPDWEHALYWKNNTLRKVSTRTLEDEPLFELDGEVTPSVLHCSAGGWVSWGYLPVEMQAKLQHGSSVDKLEPELRTGCGFKVYDLKSNQLALDVRTPFWPNHVAASPDHRWILYSHEGSWAEQRMYLYDVLSSASHPLRPQDDGVRIGHEFWIAPGIVGYHGTKEGRGFFGVIDVESGEYTERPSPEADNQNYAHYHVSPDGRYVVTDGEISTDRISISSLQGTQLDFKPVCTHDWARKQDQRYHPHPHWHQRGGHITFTGCERAPGGEVRSRVCLLELPPSWQV